ncbi:GcrA family cell cycle regulator [Xanthobacter autotrophicus]|uniref:GcrA family cell cycle regulator n=1 Tax=Xanthobacter autotrophicus TaxID=280 RepID=UPI00372A340A
MRGDPLPEAARTRIAELDAEGRSASQIAEALGNEFRVYKTRNAIIGLIHRMGLRKTRESRANKPAPEPAAQAVKKQSRHSSRSEGGRPLRPAPVKAPAAPILVPSAPAPAGGVGLLNLEHHHCRAIVGRGPDGLATFCGAPKSSGSYCAEHARHYSARLASFSEAAE